MARIVVLDCAYAAIPPPDFCASILTAVTVLVLLSERQSAQVAVVGSTLIFAMAWMWQRGTSRVLAIAWCLAFALVLPLTFAAYQADLQWNTHCRNPRGPGLYFGSLRLSMFSTLPGSASAPMDARDA